MSYNPGQAGPEGSETCPTKAHSREWLRYKGASIARDREPHSKRGAAIPKHGERRDTELATEQTQATSVCYTRLNGLAAAAYHPRRGRVASDE